jgi:hypothetical protein
MDVPTQIIPDRWLKSWHWGGRAKRIWFLRRIGIGDVKAFNKQFDDSRDPGSNGRTPEIERFQTESDAHPHVLTGEPVREARVEA